jgi:lipid A disaccharide synthetase
VDGQWKGAFMETKNLVTPGQRKDEVEITLRYLENQRQEMEDNLRWVSKAAYHSRVAFLEEVAGWYRDELAQFISSTTDTECSSSDQNS